MPRLVLVFESDGLYILGCTNIGVCCINNFYVAYCIDTRGKGLETGSRAELTGYPRYCERSSLFERQLTDQSLQAQTIILCDIRYNQ